MCRNMHLGFCKNSQTTAYECCKCNLVTAFFNKVQDVIQMSKIKMSTAEDVLNTECCNHRGWGRWLIRSNSSEISALETPLLEIWLLKSRTLAIKLRADHIKTDLHSKRKTWIPKSCLLSKPWTERLLRAFLYSINLPLVYTIYLRTNRPISCEKICIRQVLASSVHIFYVREEVQIILMET